MKQWMKRAVRTLCGKMMVAMEVSLYQMKEELANLDGEIRKAKMQIAEDAGKPGVKMEALRELKTRADELTERRELLAARVTEMEEAAKARMQGGEDPGAVKMSKEEACGRFFQTALMGGNVRQMPKMVYEQLGAIPAGEEALGTGSNLLPTQMSNDLIMEPLEDNPLRAHMTVTQVTGLELPKLGFTVEDDDFIAKDGQTAKEIKLKGDKVTFGNNKMMLKAKVSESILRSSALNVEAAVNSGLQSAQASKELKVIFATAPKVGEEHMSLYSAQNGIKEVTGKTMLDAIMACYADLEDPYTSNARVVMRRVDYVNMIRDLANGAESLFGKKPEEVIGLPVVFCSKATQPVVGDFKYLHQNFNSAPLYDTDKDVDSGIRLFVLTHWYDIKVRLSSAFRRAKVAPGG